MSRTRRSAPDPGGWGARWRALVASFGWSTPAAGGKTDATRPPRPRDLEIGTFGIAARMQDPHGFAEPRIAIESLPPDVKARALAAMATQARFAASLLSGTMPEQVDAAFAESGHPLLPESPREIKQSCTCGEPSPCRHLVALHELLAERLARDPFVLFLLRGIEKDELLRELRHNRSAPAPSAAETAARLERQSPSARFSPLPEVPPERFFRPLLPPQPIAFAPPTAPDAVLARLGPPPLEDAEAARLLFELHRAIGLGAKERLSEWEWRRS